MRRKQLKISVLAVLVLVFMFLFLNFTPIVQASVSEKVIRIGYVPGYCIITEEGEESEKGYGYEYFAEIAKYTGWTYEYVSCGWSEGLELLESGEIDIFGPIQKNAQREQEYSFTKNEIGKEYSGLFIGSDNTKYNFEDAKSFQGMRIGTDKNNFFNDVLRNYCKDNNLDVELVYTDERNYEKELKEGKYDSVLNGSMMVIPDTILAVKFTLEPCYLVTSKENFKLRDQIDKALNRIEMDDMHFAMKLYNKYYKDNPINIPAFTKEEKEFIKETQTIKVAGDPNWAPICYEQKGKCAGISVDVLHKIEQISGLNFEFVSTKNYQESKKLLKEGQVDLLLPHTESAIGLGVVYTEPFYQVSTMLVGKKDFNLEKPMRVGVSNIQTDAAKKIIKKFPNFEMIPYANTKELLNSLNSGKEQYVYINTYVYDDIIRGKNRELYYAMPIDISFPLRIGVSINAEVELLSILNKSIGRLSENVVDSIVFANTVNRAYKITFSMFIRENIYFVITMITLFFTIVLVVILIFNKKNHKILKQVAFVDELTGLPTLAKFRKDSISAVRNAPSSNFLLASIDIDNFKYVNDVFGYEMGNEFLKVISSHFLKHTMAYKLLGRNGADNFLFLVDGKNKEEAIGYFFDMLNLSEELHDLLPMNYNLVLSAGICEISDPNEPFASWCDKANIARKSVKGGHVTTMQEYTKEMDSRMHWKKEITLSMEEALEHGDFKVYFQPKYRFSDEVLAGAEALVRWEHPQNGLIMPFSFIPLFESNGFIVKLDFYMFRKVCSYIRKWLDKGWNVPSISVNLSRLHLSNENLVQDLLSIAMEYDIPEGLLEVELTESIVLDDPKTLIRIMEELKAAGFKISVDDFGSGYSSLCLLTDLPVDILKLDKGFLRKMSETSNNSLIVEQVVELAKKLKLSTVAEGVETKEQVEFLRELGCDLAQGYYFAKPMPADDFEKELKRCTIE